MNFRTDQGEVTLRALAGNFPPYGRGIPEDLRKLPLDRRDFIEILKQATALKSPTTNFVSLTFNKDTMVFHSIAEGAGESEIEYDYEWGQDDSLQITINPDFMLQTLSTIRGDDVDLEIGNEMTPTILREYDTEDGLQSFCVYAVVRQ
jgi:DNA polymerase-3 subunit beta